MIGTVGGWILLGVVVAASLGVAWTVWREHAAKR